MRVRLFDALKNEKVCEITLNSGVFDDEGGFNMHRVVVLDLNAKEAIIHDPDRGPHFKIHRELFLQAWLGETISEPEPCVYEKV